MHGRQVALGARFVELAGWQVPDTFRTPEEELAAAHAGLGLVDLSALTKLRLLGAGVVDHLATRRPDAAVPRPGAVQHLGSGSEALLLGLVADEYLQLSDPTAPDGSVGALQHGPGADGAAIHTADVTSTLLAIGLAGPRCRDLLRRVTSLDLRPWRFPDLTCAQGQVAEITGLLARVDRGGLPSYLLLASRGYGEYLWDTLWQAGGALGVAPLGWRAWRALED
jgi:sarcosine oxidase subunit alpha